MRGVGIRSSFAVGVALIGAATWSIAAAEMKFHYDCRIVHIEQIPWGDQGRTTELDHFECRISGGLLNGFVAAGTNLLEPRAGGARLVGSTVIAQKGNSILAYEVTGTARRFGAGKNGVVHWESTGTGIYNRATGSAAALTGKSFTARVRSDGPRAFTIDTVVSE